MQSSHKQLKSLLGRAGALRFGVAAAVQSLVMGITILGYLLYQVFLLQSMLIQDRQDYTFWRMISDPGIFAFLVSILAGMAVFTMLTGLLGVFVGRRWAGADPWGLWSGVTGMLGTAICAGIVVAAIAWDFDDRGRFDAVDFVQMSAFVAGFFFILGIPTGLIAGWLTRLKAQRVLADFGGPSKQQNAS